jgi:hypothetical protein
MKNFLLSKLFGYVGKKLDGYKTTISGISSILFGVLGIVANIFPENINIPGGVPDIEVAYGFIAAGLGIMGVGGKIEKLNTKKE